MTLRAVNLESSCCVCVCVEVRLVIYEVHTDDVGVRVLITSQVKMTNVAVSSPESVAALSFEAWSEKRRRYDVLYCERERAFVGRSRSGIR